MPNHCKNRVTAAPEVIEKLIGTDDEGNPCVDFGRIVPQPIGLEDSEEWNKQNWGTKWNAYASQRIGDSQVDFVTAWGPPNQVMERLNEMTKQAFTHEWVGEPIDFFVGLREYHADVGYEERDLDETLEGYWLAYMLE